MMIVIYYYLIIVLKLVVEYVKFSSLKYVDIIIRKIDKKNICINIFYRKRMWGRVRRLRGNGGGGGL